MTGPTPTTTSPPNNPTLPATSSTTPDPQHPPLLRPQHPPPKLPSRPRKLRKLSPPPSTSSSLSPSHPRPPPRLLQIPRSLSSEAEIDSALRHLRTSDPLLSPLIDSHPRPTFDSIQPPFLALTKSILYQQLAYKAGSSIYSRFISLCGGEAGVLPASVLSLNPQQLRQIGVSSRKASYLHDLARKYENGILSDKAILGMDDKSLFTMLTMVNGIGSWSVYMFMIFSLHRPDVLPVNDLQVRKGVQVLYGLDELPRPSQMEQLCEKWRPYRSVGAWYMWRLVEAKGASCSTGAVVASPVGMALPGSVAEQQQPQQQHQLLALTSSRQHQQTQHQHQPQFVDPINGMMNVGSNLLN